MSLQSKEDLVEKLRTKKFRDAFVSSRVSNTLAFQIRALRQKRDLSQTVLARQLGTSQNAVCRLENPQYGRPSITTLKKLASLFDVGLVVWFVPFSELVDRFTTLSTESLLVPAFDEEAAKRQSEAAIETSKLPLPSFWNTANLEVPRQSQHEEFDLRAKPKIGIVSVVQASERKQELGQVPTKGLLGPTSTLGVAG